MIAATLNLLFGCRHRSLTRPITAVHRPGTPSGETYVACLDCGKRFTYDAAKMCIVMPPNFSVALRDAIHRHA